VYPAPRTSRFRLPSAPGPSWRRLALVRRTRVSRATMYAGEATAREQLIEKRHRRFLSMKPDLLQLTGCLGLTR
jgi:hypothetical protein